MVYFCIHFFHSRGIKLSHGSHHHHLNHHYPHYFEGSKCLFGKVIIKYLNAGLDVDKVQLHIGASPTTLQYPVLKENLKTF